MGGAPGGLVLGGRDAAAAALSGGGTARGAAAVAAAQTSLVGRGWWRCGSGCGPPAGRRAATSGEVSAGRRAGGRENSPGKRACALGRGRPLRRGGEGRWGGGYMWGLRGWPRSPQGTAGARGGAGCRRWKAQGQRLRGLALGARRSAAAGEAVATRRLAPATKRKWRPERGPFAADEARQGGWGCCVSFPSPEASSGPLASLGLSPAPELADGGGSGAHSAPCGREGAAPGGLGAERRGRGLWRCGRGAGHCLPHLGGETGIRGRTPYPVLFSEASGWGRGGWHFWRFLWKKRTEPFHSLGRTGMGRDLRM